MQNFITCKLYYINFNFNLKFLVLNKYIMNIYLNSIFILIIIDYIQININYYNNFINI